MRQRRLRIDLKTFLLKNNMNEENDNYLCVTYPKMFVNRNSPMTETCMCWGFECGNGWFNIINQLCQNIQHHIDWSIQNNEQDLKYNEENPDKLKTVRPICNQVTVDQVKEKFGTLRFYYTGGDDYIRGLASMAESMSGVTCEECGNLASTNYPEPGGWISTICDPCKEKRERAYQNYKENTLNN